MRFLSLCALVGALAGCAGSSYETARLNESEIIVYDISNLSLDEQFRKANQIIARHPNAPEGFALRAKIRFQWEKYQLSARDMQAAIDRGGKQPENFHLFGMSHFYMGNYNAALIGLQHAFNLDPTSEAVHFGLGQIYQKLRKKRLSVLHYDQAIYFASLTIRTDDRNKNAFEIRYGSRFAQEKFREAIEDINRMIAISEPSATLFYHQGKTYMELHDLNKAEHAFKESLKLKNNDPLIFSNLGTIYFMRNQFEKAQGYLEVSVRLQRNNPPALFLLGEIHSRARRHVTAIRFYQEAAILNRKLRRTCYQRIQGIMRAEGLAEQ